MSDASDAKSESLGDSLSREIGFASSLFPICAWHACEQERRRAFLLTLVSAVGSVSLFAASLRSSGRGVYVGFKAKWVQICSAPLSLLVFYVGLGRSFIKHVYMAWVL